MNNGKKYNVEVIQSLSTNLNVSERYVRECLRNEERNSDIAQKIRLTYNERLSKINKELNL